MSKNIAFDRQRFDQLIAYYGQHDIAPQTAQLRFEIPLVDGRGFYEAVVNREGGLVKRLTETWLARNDAFVTTAFGMSLMVEENAYPGTAPLQTYPLIEGASTDISGNGYIPFGDAKAVEAIFNGTMEINTGQTNNFTGIPLRHFRKVPQTQPAENAGDSIGLIPQFNAEEMMLNLPEKFVFAGTKDQKIRVEFPSYPDLSFLSDTYKDTHTPYLVIIFDGWVIKNGTNARFQEERNPIGRAIA